MTVVFLLYKFRQKKESLKKIQYSISSSLFLSVLLKGGIPATPSGTATLLRLSPSYQFYPR